MSAPVADPGPQRARNLHAHEIELGRSVVNNWDKALVEPWARRKARLAAERAGRSAVAS
jgi:hypothetical protein